VGDAPLRGRRILVTAAEGGTLSHALEELGAEVVHVPLIAVEPAAKSKAVARALADLPAYDYVVFTSANAVRAFATVAGRAGGTAMRVSGPEFVAVGPATAGAAEAAGFHAAKMPSKHTGTAVAEMLVALGVRGKRVLIPRARVADEALPAKLRAAGADVRVLPLYRTVTNPDAAPRLAPLLGSGLDMVTFASGSAARALREVVGPGSRLPRGLRVTCIGPSTAQAAEKAGFSPDVVADVHSAGGLADAITRFYAARPRRRVTA
jgi:uroporphyrinogen III methyltransferase/synthase